MQVNGNGPFFVLLGVFTSLTSLFTMIVWLVVGWRAMRAHERIAETLRERLGRAE